MVRKIWRRTNLLHQDDRNLQEPSLSKKTHSLGKRAQQDRFHFEWTEALSLNNGGGGGVPGEGEPFQGQCHLHSARISTPLSTHFLPHLRAAARRPALARHQKEVGSKRQPSCLLKWKCLKRAKRLYPLPSPPPHAAAESPAGKPLLAIVVK